MKGVPLEETKIAKWLRTECSLDEARGDIGLWAHQRAKWSNFSDSDIKINIFVRSNINWSYVNQETIEKLHEAGGYPFPIFNGIRIWNDHFKLDYFSYRRFLQSISEQTWSNIRQTDSILKDDCKFIEMLVDHERFKKVVILPTDDDDWYSPDISQMLSEAYAENPDADVISWNCGSVHYQKGLAFTPFGKRRFLTNGYAVTGRGVEKLWEFGQGVGILVLNRHAAAKRIFTEHSGLFNIVDIEDDTCYSIKNSSPASLTDIRKLGDGELDIADLSESIVGSFEAVPRAMEWAAQHIRCMELINYAPDLAIPGASDSIQSLVDKAEKHGVERLVLLSGRGEDEAQVCEQIVQSSNIDSTVIRASWFDQNFSEGAFVEMVLAGQITLPAGDTQEPFIDVEDIAEVAVAALTQPGHAGEVYEVTGPRLLTFADIARELSQANGTEIQYVSVPHEAFVSSMADSGAPRDVVWLLDYLFTTVLDGRNAYLSDGVQRALGREPRDFVEYARDVAATNLWKTAA